MAPTQGNENGDGNSVKKILSGFIVLFIILLLLVLGFKNSYAAGLSKTVEVAIVKVKFVEDTAQSNPYGFDNYTNPDIPWKSVKVTSSDTAKAEIAPNVTSNEIYFKSTIPANVTVSPNQATSTPQTITVTGVAKGKSEIQANGGSVDGPNAGKMEAASYNLQTNTVAIILVHEENDDVQIIPVGRGKPNTVAIKPCFLCTLKTTAADLGGDDQIVGNTVTAGADGICQTAAKGDDIQVIPVGNGEPDAVCVSQGPNAARDTNLSGDDGLTWFGFGDDIITGPDGICDTAANSTPISSTDISSIAGLRTYLNSKVYNQAVFSWVVIRLSACTVNFDLNRDGMIDVESWMSTEMQAVRDKCKDDFYDHNLFLVDNPSDHSLGFMDFKQRSGFIHVGEITGPVLNENHVVAHELGHGGFGLRHPSERGQPVVDPDNLR